MAPLTLYRLTEDFGSERTVAPAPMSRFPNRPPTNPLQGTTENAMEVGLRAYCGSVVGAAKPAMVLPEANVAAWLFRSTVGVSALIVVPAAIANASPSDASVPPLAV